MSLRRSPGCGAKCRCFGSSWKSRCGNLSGGLPVPPLTEWHPSHTKPGQPQPQPASEPGRRAPGHRLAHWHRSARSRWQLRRRRGVPGRTGIRRAMTRVQPGPRRRCHVPVPITSKDVAPAGARWHWLPVGRCHCQWPGARRTLTRPGGFCHGRPLRRRPCGRPGHDQQTEGLRH